MANKFVQKNRVLIKAKYINWSTFGTICIEIFYGYYMWLEEQ